MNSEGAGSQTQPFNFHKLPSYIVKALVENGYEALTDVQIQAIPLVLQGGDLLVRARTGTGKTAAFAIPLLIAHNEDTPTANTVHTLVLTPTRELALQVEQFFLRYGKYSPAKVRTLCLIGGVAYELQQKAARSGVNIVIATPGRLIDMLDKNELSLSHLQTLVIDEADKLLNDGFFDELNAILSRLPATHQTLLFSATFPPKVSELAARVLAQPSTIEIDSDTHTTDKIAQRVIEVPSDRRRMLLMHLFQSEQWKRVLVFVASKRAAANLAGKLKANGISAMALHGDLTQDERVLALSRFTARKIQMLVATDIAARGIDFQQISHVVNFDLPRSPADYIHRIGRTGRAEEQGVAVSFIDHKSRAHFALIEKRAGILLSSEQIAGFELPPDSTVKVRGAAPKKGKRKSKKDKLREAAAKKN